MTQTSGRLLQLLSLLQTRRDWPGDELARRLEVSGRTIRRDVERLRELGYPVQATTGPDGGYRLEAGTAMPPLLLDDDEAVAIAVGLRTSAGASVEGIEETSVRALVKLEQVLPAHLRRRVNALNEATTTLSRGNGPTVNPETLTSIATACRDHECLRFAYRAKDGVETRRLVEPHSLVNIGQRWYFVAWDLGRDAWRTFRLDRIEQVSPAGRRFTPRKLPGGDPAAYVSKNLSGSSPRHEARVTLRASAAEVALRSPWVASSLEPIDAVSCEYRATDQSLEWLALRLGMIGVDFEVHEPPALIDQCARLAERFGGVSAPAPSGVAPPLIGTVRVARRDPNRAVLEGFHAVKHALRFGAEIETLVTADAPALGELTATLAEDLATQIEGAAPIDAATLEQLAPFPPAGSVLAIARRPAFDLAAVLEDPAVGRIVLLENPRRLGNVGACVRAAAAAGAHAVLTTGAADPWHPDALRGAAGLHYALPVARVTVADIDFGDRPLIAIDPDGEPLGTSHLPERAVLAFGTERHGLTDELLARADARVSIPMQEGVSSLNLATAVAVALYA